MMFCQRETKKESLIGFLKFRFLFVYYCGMPDVKLNRIISNCFIKDIINMLIKWINTIIIQSITVMSCMTKRRATHNRSNIRLRVRTWYFNRRLLFYMANVYHRGALSCVYYVIVLVIKWHSVWTYIYL